MEESLELNENRGAMRPMQPAHTLNLSDDPDSCAALRSWSFLV